jgi:DNA polymerase-1
MSANKFMIYSRANYGVEVSEEDAMKFRSDYFRMYPGIQEYHNYMRQYIYERGYAENIIGERRYLPTHRSDDSYERWRAWSEGVNYTIQGSAAAIIKLAMLKISRSLYRPFGRAVHPDFGRVVTCWGTDDYDPEREVYMFAQVHDELDFFVSAGIAEDFAKWVKHIMETVVTLRVPVEAEYGIGRTFGDAK